LGQRRFVNQPGSSGSSRRTSSPTVAMIFREVARSLTLLGSRLQFSFGERFSLGSRRGLVRPLEKDAMPTSADFTGERNARFAASVAARRARTWRKRARWSPAGAGKSRQVQQHAGKTNSRGTPSAREFTDRNERIVFRTSHTRQSAQSALGQDRIASESSALSLTICDPSRTLLYAARRVA
jgi:hypothetical protein